MKSAFGVVAAVSVALSAGVVFAEAGKRGAALFERIDANKDGRISGAEARIYQDQKFRELDADGNGTVSFEEMLAAKQARLRTQTDKRFQRLDANGNGSIEPDELAAKSDRRFHRMDDDGDGALTLDEIRKHRHNHHQRRKDG